MWNFHRRNGEIRARDTKSVAKRLVRRRCKLIPKLIGELGKSASKLYAILVIFFIFQRLLVASVLFAKFRRFLCSIWGIRKSSASEKWGKQERWAESATSGFAKYAEAIDRSLLAKILLPRYYSPNFENFRSQRRSRSTESSDKIIKIPEVFRFRRHAEATALFCRLKGFRLNRKSPTDRGKYSEGNM